MAFPPTACGAIPVPAECCTTLFDQGETIIEAFREPLCRCIVKADCCGDDLRYFISAGQPETWQADFLAAWIEGISVVSRSNSGQPLIVPMVSVNWRVMLRESCYPGLVVEGDDMWTPSDDDFHQANAHLYAHGQAMLQAVASLHSTCEGIALRDFVPLRPERYTAGWTVGLTYGLPRF